jgi:hypothetical protein
VGQNLELKLVTGQNFDSAKKLTIDEQNKNKFNITEALVHLKILRYLGYP